MDTPPQAPSLSNLYDDGNSNGGQASLALKSRKSGDALRGGRGRGRGRGGGRGSGGGERVAVNRDTKPAGRKNTKTQRLTHFLAIPLHNHADLRTRVSSFQNALLGVDPGLGSSNLGKKSSPIVSTSIEGLDTSIIIDPRRLHFTLAAMALEPDEEPQAIGVKAGPLPDVVPHQVRRASDVVAPSSELSRSTIQVEELTPDAPLVETISDAGRFTVDRAPEPSSALQIDATVSPLGSFEIRVNPEKIPLEASSSMVGAEEAVPPTSLNSPTETQPSRKTVGSALALLQSLKPRITEALGGATGVKVPLNTMDVLKTERIRPAKRKPSNEQPGELPVAMQMVEEDKVGAGVLFLGPGRINKDDQAGQRLLKICEIIIESFRDAGYLTDTRPLTLHCTILNASHRKPRRWYPFSYTDIRLSSACHCLLGGTEDIDVQVTTDDPDHRHRQSTDGRGGALGITNQTDGPISESPAEVVSVGNNSKSTWKSRASLKVPDPLPVNLGYFHVDEIQLWVMGSHGPRNEYVSCGGIVLE